MKNCETELAVLKARMSTTETNLSNNSQPNAGTSVGTTGKTLEKTFKSLLTIEKVKEWAVLLNFPQTRRPMQSYSKTCNRWHPNWILKLRKWSKFVFPRLNSNGYSSTVSIVVNV